MILYNRIVVFDNMSMIITKYDLDKIFILQKP